jgi:hypothetical protein
MHLTKPGQGNLTARALERVTGSGAFVAAARALWFVAPDPNASDDAQSSNVRVLVRGKGNLAPDVGALAFKIVPHKVSDKIETSRVEWIGPTQVSVEEATISMIAEWRAMKPRTSCASGSRMGPFPQTTYKRRPRSLALRNGR